MNAAPSRWVRRGLGILTASLLVSAAGAAYLRQDARVVSVDAAVDAFRSTTASTTTTDLTTVTARTVPSEGPSPTVAAPSSAGQRPDATIGPSGATAPAPTPTAASAAPQPTPAAGPATSASTLGRVQEGVYIYDTDGFEETNALGGARHDYPRQTAVTVRGAACGGWTQRWQPLEERWDESDLCPEGEDPRAISVRRFVTYHEFFQRSQQQDFTCPEGSHVFRTDAPAGATWTWRCTAGSSAIDSKVTVVGTEPVVVEGRAVEAVHIHYDSTLSGGNRGTQDQHRWIDPETGLNLKIVTAIDTEADSPFGAVHYVEKYTIQLASMTPRT